MEGNNSNVLRESLFASVSKSGTSPPLIQYIHLQQHVKHISDLNVLSLPPISIILIIMKAEGAWGSLIKARLIMTVCTMLCISVETITINCGCELLL